MVEVAGNRKLTSAQPVRARLAGLGGHRFDFRYGPLVADDNQGLTFLDAAEHVERVTLDFVDTDRIHVAILPGEFGASDRNKANES